MFIDTHCHPILQKDKTILDILKNFQRSGGKYLVSIGTDLQSSKESLEFAKKQTYSYTSIGIHPCDISKETGVLEEKMNILEILYIQNKDKIVAIGETGLDYYRINKENLEEQKKLQKKYFIAQIQLAKKYNLPVVVHNRESGEDIFNILKESGYKNFIIHCFSENLEYAEKCIKYAPECKISFSGIVTFKNAKDIQETAKNIPLKNILIETDAPYLTPTPLRGKEENEPAFTQYILDEIINLRHESPEIIRDTIYNNSINIYRLQKIR